MSLANFWELTNDSAFVTAQTEFLSYLGKIWPREKIMESIKVEAAKNSFFLRCEFKMEERWTPFFHPCMIDRYLESIKCDLNLVMVSEEEFYLSPIPEPLATLKLREILYGKPVSNFAGGCACPDCCPDEKEEEICECGQCPPLPKNVRVVRLSPDEIREVIRTGKLPVPGSSKPSSGIPETSEKTETKPVSPKKTDSGPEKTKLKTTLDDLRSQLEKIRANPQEPKPEITKKK